MDKNVLAIIPARAGSKRLKDKNILPLAGKPLIQWSIESALASTVVDRVVVSSDSEEIERIARECGVEVPFRRPSSLASDTASTMSVVNHALNFFGDKGVQFSHVILLQPTSPLRRSIDIDRAFSLMVERHASSVVSVTECEHSPLWSNTLPENLGFDDFLHPDVMTKRSQDLPQYYRLNGAIYIADLMGRARLESFYSEPNKYAYVMPKEYSVDIDTIFDFKMAELLMSEGGLFCNG